MARDIAVKCLRCGKVRQAGAWVEEKDAGLRGGELFSHAYCPKCEKKARAELAGEIQLFKKGVEMEGEGEGDGK